MQKRIQKDQYDEMVQELEGDVMSLASRAALELSDFIDRKNPNFQAVRRLAELLASPKSQNGASWPRILLSEPMSEIALIDAITVLNNGVVPIDMNDLLMESNKIASRLTQIATCQSNIDPREAKELRRFCLELFDSVSGFSEPLYERFPEDSEVE